MIYKSGDGWCMNKLLCKNLQNIDRSKTVKQVQTVRKLSLKSEKIVCIPDLFLAIFVLIMMIIIMTIDSIYIQ